MSFLVSFLFLLSPDVSIITTNPRFTSFHRVFSNFCFLMILLFFFRSQSLHTTMSEPLEVKKDLFWVGTLNPEMRIFDVVNKFVTFFLTMLF